MKGIQSIGVSALVQSLLKEGQETKETVSSALQEAGLECEIREDFEEPTSALMKSDSFPSIFCEDADCFVNWNPHGRGTGCFVKGASAGTIARIVSEAAGHVSEAAGNGEIDELTPRKPVCVYAGRFQPFHKGHHQTYQHLVQKFGEGNVFIGTSNKVDPPRSPFNFQEKQRIITGLFDIPASHVVEVRSPYAPKEILERFDPQEHFFVTAVSEKDQGRLMGGKYFTPYREDEEYREGYKDKGYVYTTPMAPFRYQGEDISGTRVRSTLRSPDVPMKEKAALFKHLYDGRFDESIFDLIISKLTAISEAAIQQFVKEGHVQKVLQRMMGQPVLESRTATVSADDGPTTWHPSYEDYAESGREMAQICGMKVVDDIMGPDDFSDHLDYGLENVSFYPSGFDSTPPVDDPEMRYRQFIRAVISGMGYELMDWMLEKAPIQESRRKRKRRIDEGGGAGHMAHPFEDLKLTFGDLKRIVSMAFDGNLDLESQPIEKVDGQNLLITWKGGEMRAARNKGDLRNFGENSMDLDALVQKFEGRGELLEAFEYAFRDLSIALGRLDRGRLGALFEDGKKWMNLEIVYPPSKNVIDYGSNFIVFHGTIEFDEGGNAIEFDKSGAYDLARMIEDVDAQAQEDFSILSPPEVEIPEIELKDLESELLSNLEAYKSEFDLSDSDRVMKWHEAWWKNFVKEKAEQFDYDIPSHVVAGFMRRWAWGNKSGDEGYGVRDMKRDIEHEDFLSWARSFDKQEYKEQFKENVRPVEEIFLRLGTEVMKRVETVLSVHPEETKRKIQQKLKDARAQIEGSANQEKVEKMQREFDRLEKAGGLQDIAVEGIVFTEPKTGRVFKLTGSWAALNQIIGTIKYGNI